MHHVDSHTFLCLLSLTRRLQIAARGQSSPPWHRPSSIPAMASPRASRDKVRDKHGNGISRERIPSVLGLDVDGEEEKRGRDDRRGRREDLTSTGEDTAEAIREKPGA